MFGKCCKLSTGRHTAALNVEMGTVVMLTVVFLLLTVRNVQSQESCVKTVVRSCADCIKSGPYCAWCKFQNFTKAGEQEAVRCDVRDVLRERGCKDADIISPQGNHQSIKNLPLTGGSNPVQIQPQGVQLNLRPNQPWTFTFKFKRAEGYPVDLYYLMDLSYSMNDDLQNVKSLGKDLLKALRKITKQSRIGFGSFVDKVVLPYTSTNPKRVQKPCPDNENFCQPAFGYKHVLSMTDNEGLFNDRVSAQAISGNLDVPEGGLDAIMQAAVCGDKIGWGNSTRLLVFTTDAGFHMAGDGKLAAILEPNDGRCHLDTNMLYSKSSEMDYPSVGQVMQKLAENNIQPIFAVTKDVEPVYRRLKDIIPKSEVGVLTSDSSNVISLIQNAYQNLSSNVIVTHDDLPDHVTVTYTSNCPNGEVPSIRGTCDNVGIGKEVEFSVTVTAHKCLTEQSFLIGPLGFREKLRVNLTTRCECECDDRKNSDDCNSQGQVSCGTCRCNKGYVGQKCECEIGTKSDAEMRQACMPVNGSMCSGQGECVCGVCHCSPGEDGRSIYGRFCQCDDRSCPLVRGQLCGGQGRCSCGTCNCNPGYEGDACDCRKSDDRCRTGNTVCNGRGNCVCNVCNCTVGYTRPFCETCPGCPVLCERVASCVECQMDGQKGKCLEVCRNVNYTEDPNLTEQRLCKRRGTDGCQMIYSTKQLQGVEMYKVIFRNKECPEPPDLRLIIGGTFSGVALIGILLLLALKAFIHMRDLKEFRRFENEQKKSKWSNADNPLFKTATTTIQNPNFGGN
ncbi:integrin beta-2-like [Brienomyrus brachyistius]|uniref:integrin beta-2-like n=1 Tax=Brienomyrus brachyistius TaxID=42636 RepID=UPI0020B2E36A|nr:integrin beta-2-like [Brienomyrus brachyistius]